MKFLVVDIYNLVWKKTYTGLIQSSFIGIIGQYLFGFGAKDLNCLAEENSEIFCTILIKMRGDVNDIFSGQTQISHTRLQAVKWMKLPRIHFIRKVISAQKLIK